MRPFKVKFYHILFRKYSTVKHHATLQTSFINYQPSLPSGKTLHSVVILSVCSFKYDMKMLKIVAYKAVVFLAIARGSHQVTMIGAMFSSTVGLML